MIEWFTRNGVAANLLMFIILVSGGVSLYNMKMELFPDFDLDIVTIRVPYPGATPEETEESICMKVEEEIQDIEGIKEMTSTAMEGIGVITLEIEPSYDSNKLLGDVKARVDSINTFPVDAEKPVVELPVVSSDVLALSLYGPADERTLKRLAERTRDELLSYPNITKVTIDTTRNYQIAIEVEEHMLRRYGLNFAEVVNAVREHSLDVPGGTVRAEAGEVLLRSVGQAYDAEAFRNIPLITRPDGSRLLIGDIARVVDGFEDAPASFRFNGYPAVGMQVFEVGDQSTLEISDIVHDYVEEAQARLPEGVRLEIWREGAYYLKGRLNMLIENGLLGLLLVFVLLALFLRPSLALWVTLGIPISFMGAFALVPWFGVSINIISLFGFIMVLGIVVDDAIVVGESIFTCFQKHGGAGVKASVEGSHAVAMPVVFAVITTAVAFLPILFLPGFQGKFMQHIPYVVIATLMISLIESKLILPYHLTLCNIGGGKRDKLSGFQRFQRRIADWLERFIRNRYQPLLEWSLSHKYAVLSLFIAVLMVTLSYVAAGYMPFSFFPRPASDYIVADLEMLEGMPREQTEATLGKMQDALDELLVELNEQGYQEPIENVGVILGGHPFQGGPHGSSSNMGQSNLGEIALEMQKAEDREVSAPDFAAMWREKMGKLPGVKDLSLVSRAAAGTSKPVSLQLAGNDYERMKKAAAEIKDKLATFAGVYDVVDDFSGGKRELQLKLRPEAEVLGISKADLGRQVRAAFYGAEAQRVQRGREDLRVMVRYPAADRKTLSVLQDMRIRTSDGREIPFYEVAEAKMGRGPSVITRVDRHRTIRIDAGLDRNIGNLAQIQQELSGEYMPELMKDYPELSWSFKGEIEEGNESMATLFSSTIIIMCVIYVLMAIPFKSYIQPLIIMSVIPFGLIGAIWGHIIFGYFFEINLSLLSMLGIVAMAGVLVNDSLVMVDYVNKQVRAGVSETEAVHNAGVVRFRPILLTSLTTFAGLAPILLERSLQAQFLKPMALSLAFGVLFGTLITLFLVPACYLILDDIKCGVRKLFGATA